MDPPCASKVATAAPATPQRRTRIKNKSSAIFRTVENRRNQKGVLLSPNARMTLERRLYKKVKGTPIKVTSR